MDWGRTQEPVYGRDGGIIGAVVYDAHQRGWITWSEAGGQEGPFVSRTEAERHLRQWAKRQPATRALSGPQRPGDELGQMVGALTAGAALLGGLAALMGGDQRRGDDQADELRRQNDELRRQNELLRETLGRMGPAPLARKK